VKLFFSNRPRPTWAPSCAHALRVCERNEHAHGQPDCESEPVSCGRAHYSFDAKTSPRVRASKSPPIRVAQTTNVGRWMRPTLVSVGALERARVVAMAVELMGTRRRPRHHSHHVRKISRHSPKPVGAQRELSAVASRTPCQASAASARARHQKEENEVGPRTHL
jgi:hypothetical protein